MKVLSLFDGMACGMLAMMDAGVNVDRYVAFEIDQYAIKTSSHNFPMIEHRGDVFQALISLLVDLPVHTGALHRRTTERPRQAVWVGNCSASMSGH